MDHLPPPSSGLREPAVSDDVLLAAIKAAPSDHPGGCLWWLGQSGFLIQYHRHYLLFDPYLSDSLTKKYALTSKPHVRLVRRVIDPARLQFVDVVTASHHHTDHLDPETLQALDGSDSHWALLAPRAHAELAAERSKLSPQRLLLMNPNDRVEIGPFTIEAIPAAHEERAVDAAGNELFLGFIVRTADWVVYHAGDTVDYPGLAEVLLAARVDLALLPINGRDSTRGVAGNLNGAEAAALAKRAQVGVTIPCHYDMFAFNTASPVEFSDACRQLNVDFLIADLGKTISFESLYKRSQRPRTNI